MESSSKQDAAALKARGDLAGLGRLLLDQDTWVRVEAADALGEIGDPAAMDALIASIAAPCQGTYADRARGAARAAMSKLGPPTSDQCRRLIEMGGSGPWEAIALMKQHAMADDAVVGLWYRAATGDWEGADASRSEAMALILEMLGQTQYSLAAVQGLRAAGAAGVPHLVALLKSDLPEKRDSFGPSLEKDALAALSAIDAPEAREAVAKHFSAIAAGSLDDKTARCRDCLVAAGGEPALSALLGELADPRPVRRAAAAAALGALDDRRALPALEEALRDGYCTVTVLESAPDNVTDEFLREAMLRTREDYPVRDAAAAAIERLRGS